MSQADIKRDEWLFGLKEGDEVAIQNTGWSRSVLIKKVDRITKTLIFCGQQSFRRKTGYSPGDGFCKASIWPATDQRKEKARQESLRSWFASLKPTIEQLEAMKKAFDSVTVS